MYVESTFSSNIIIKYNNMVQMSWNRYTNMADDRVYLYSSDFGFIFFFFSSKSIDDPSLPMTSTCPSLLHNIRTIATRLRFDMALSTPRRPCRWRCSSRRLGRCSRALVRRTVRIARRTFGSRYSEAPAMTWTPCRPGRTLCWRSHCSWQCD